jgi:hypothetical protein
MTKQVRIISCVLDNYAEARIRKDLIKISSLAFVAGKLFKELLELCPEQKTPEEKLNFQHHIAFQQMYQMD